MAVLMLIDTSEPPEQPWRPNPRVAWRLAVCIVLLVAGLILSGVLAVLCVFTSLMFGIDAGLTAMPYLDGLREHRQ